MKLNLQENKIKERFVLFEINQCFHLLKRREETREGTSEIKLDYLHSNSKSYKDT